MCAFVYIEQMEKISMFNRKCMGEVDGKLNKKNVIQFFQELTKRLIKIRYLSNC